MSLPTISDEDLALLSEAMPGLDFTDPERAAVLRMMGSCDVQAAPGSGKTTLLAAKLTLLASKWKHSNRGVCVISHTNVAAAEISKRLAGSPQGASLLGHPHFIGTIHSFVNTHLALPFLRTQGTDVDSIDNEIFGKNALYLMWKKPALRAWLKRQANGEEIVRTLIHVGVDLAIGTEKGQLPSKDSPTWKQASEIKRELSQRGIFRHADMFAFATRLLRDFPAVSVAASFRFPLVLIDEMQDTDAEQEAMLDSIFGDEVIVQRFGDRNQRILSGGKEEAKLTFPRDGALTVSSTKRFPTDIASVVSSVQDYPASVVSHRPSEQPPTVILYDDATVTNVIERFGRLVLEELTDTQLASAPVKAICARKAGDSGSGLGRHVGDYFPVYAMKSPTSGGKESIRTLLTDPAGWGDAPLGLASRTRDVSRALLLGLRAGNSPLVKDLRDANRLIRALESKGVDLEPIRRLRHHLVTSTGLAGTDSWQGTMSHLFNTLRSYLDDGVDEAAFIAALEDGAGAGLAHSIPDNVMRVDDGDRSVSIEIATTASVKGETHLATLVLDSMVHYLRRHDIGAAMDSIALGSPIPSKPKSIKSAYRGLYVGMSRPTTLLAIATHKDRVSTAHLAALESNGWRVIRIDP